MNVSYTFYRKKTMIDLFLTISSGKIVWFLICLFLFLSFVLVIWAPSKVLPSLVHGLGFCHTTVPVFRFGLALAKVRTLNLKRNKRLALEFIRRAKKTSNSLDHRNRINAMWSKHAKLDDVIQFLSKRS